MIDFCFSYLWKFLFAFCSPDNKSFSRKKASPDSLTPTRNFYLGRYDIDHHQITTFFFLLNLKFSLLKVCHRTIDLIDSNSKFKNKSLRDTIQLTYIKNIPPTAFEILDFMVFCYNSIRYL